MIKIEIDVITLAYAYLQRKHRRTGQNYTIADLFDTAEKILKWSEHKGGKKALPTLLFKDNVLSFEEKVIE